MLACPSSNIPEREEPPPPPLWHCIRRGSSWLTPTKPLLWNPDFSPSNQGFPISNSTATAVFIPNTPCWERKPFCKWLVPTCRRGRGHNVAVAPTPAEPAALSCAIPGGQVPATQLLSQSCQSWRSGCFILLVFGLKNNSKTSFFTKHRKIKTNLLRRFWS